MRAVSRAPVPKTGLLNNAHMRIFAIDPGYDRLGMAVLEGDPSKPVVVWSDCILPPKDTRERRLSYVLQETQKAIREYKPDALGIETLFFSTNVKTALGVAEARGAILAAAGSAGVPVIECSPQHVKLAVTGHGGAKKTDVAHMVEKLVALVPKKKRLDDEFDAIAVGIAALAIGLKTH